MHALKKSNVDPVFWSTASLTIILYILSLTTDAFLVSRISLPLSAIKLTTTLIFLGIAIFLTNHANNPIDATTFHWPSTKNQRTLAILAFSIVLVKVSIKYLAIGQDVIDSSALCKEGYVDPFATIRSCLVSPALETILFASLLPTLFLHRYRDAQPLTAFVVVSLIFSALHLSASPVTLVTRLFVGIIFCYVYFGMNSLLAAFLLHVGLNTIVFLLDSFGGSICKLGFSINFAVMSVICVAGLFTIFAVLKSLHRKIYTLQSASAWY